MFMHDTLMSGVMFGTATRTFASRVCCETHDLYLFWLLFEVCARKCSFAEFDVHAKGIDTLRCRLNQYPVGCFS